MFVCGLSDNSERVNKTVGCKVKLGNKRWRINYMFLTSVIKLCRNFLGIYVMHTYIFTCNKYAAKKIFSKLW